MNKPKALGILAVTSGLFFNTTVLAQDFLKSGPSVFNYNYVDVAYLDSDDSDAIGIRFSADFKENLAFNAAFLKNNDFDANLLSVGATYHIQTTNYPKADWIFSAGIARISGDDIRNTETGFDLSGGLRYGLSDELELNGQLSLSTLGETDLTITLRALYEVATGFSAFVETDIGDGSGIGIGGRFYWR